MKKRVFAAVLAATMLCGFLFSSCAKNVEKGTSTSDATSAAAVSGQNSSDVSSTLPVNYVKTVSERPEADRGVWEQRADATHRFMREHFFGGYNMFNNVYPLTRQKDNNDFHYWIQAQVLDSIVDAYIRTGDKTYAQQAKDLIFAVKKRNGGYHLLNSFYDDMGWMANAMLRLYVATGDEDLSPDLKLLAETIFDAWNPRFGGGIPWKKDQIEYKNSPSNGPACILAARLYQHTGEQEYLDMANNIFNWWTKTLVDPETGLVWDGINRNNDRKIDKDWKFTYCQGVYIGSCVELYNITKDNSYIEKAVKTADYTLGNLLGSGAVLQDEGGGDGGAFKGIFCRYLTQLIKATPVNREEYCEFLEQNGITMWSNIPGEEEPIFNSLWSKKAVKPEQLQVESSGLALLECLADLYKSGYITNP